MKETMNQLRKLDLEFDKVSNALTLQRDTIRFLNEEANRLFSGLSVKFGEGKQSLETACGEIIELKDRLTSRKSELDQLQSLRVTARKALETFVAGIETDNERLLGLIAQVNRKLG